MQFTEKTCTAVIINTTNDTLVYDHWDLGGTTQWLNGACIQNNAEVGMCEFGGSLENGVWIKFVIPFYICSRVKLNRPFPLGSGTQNYLINRMSLIY